MTGLVAAPALLPREFRLLEYMMRRKEQVLTRAMLLQEVWNYKFVPQTNLVAVHMGRLRRKVDERHELPMIHIVRGEVSSSARLSDFADATAFGPSPSPTAFALCTLELFGFVNEDGRLHGVCDRWSHRRLHNPSMRFTAFDTQPRRTRRRSTCVRAADSRNGP